MRKADIKPGVVYVYREPLSGSVHPLIFLEGRDYGKGCVLANTLWRQPSWGTPPRAFVRAERHHTKPRRGSVYNDGVIGYPAATLLDTPCTTASLSNLRAVTIADFANATSTWDEARGIRFLVVTSMARILEPWEA